MSETVLALLVNQVFEFHDAEDGNTYWWHATEGRRLAEARGAESQWLDLLEAGFTPESVRCLFPDLDFAKARALPMSTLYSPLLFVPHRGKHVLIDGSHRLYRAICAGVPE